MGGSENSKQVRSVLRDAAGRITSFVHTNKGNPTPNWSDQTFGYDNLNRLLSASATLGGPAVQYTYDATGNRKTKTIGGTTYSNTVSSTSNRLTQVQDAGGPPYSITYDNAGNITGDGMNTFAYSDRGRMSTATNAGGVVNYKYNGLEQRVSKIGSPALVPTGAAYFVYDEQGKLLGEYDASGNPVYESVYLGAVPVGVLKRTGDIPLNNLAVSVYNVYADHLATPRVVTRPSDRAIVWRWDGAESFGGTAPNENPNGIGAFKYNQRMPGQVFDAETGLFQNWNREYSPRVGRYIQSDPIGLQGGINTYAYVDGNPVSYYDPYGLWAWGDPLPQGLIDGVAGFGDSFLIPELIRDALDIDGGVNQCSAAYHGGKVTGFVVGSVPFALRGAAAVGGTRFGHVLNHNRYLRMGPGRMPANGTGLPAGTGVPRLSIGPQIKGGPPNPHVDLRSRLSYVPPIGGPAECGCP